MEYRKLGNLEVAVIGLGTLRVFGIKAICLKGDVVLIYVGRDADF